MRYAVFTDVHANLEALEAVLAEIDSLAKENPIDQIWFLGDLVGYGPNPNECIELLRKRTDVIIAGNHDWAAVGKIDLEDFSAAARISAEWTAQQLMEEHRDFLSNLPERLEIGECTLVHGSPYGPLWEYLTSEALAERSFQHFTSRLCFVGHTHVPVIFQQPDSIANAPTLPLEGTEKNGQSRTEDNLESEQAQEAAQTPDMAVVSSIVHTSTAAAQAESAYADPATGQPVSEQEANSILEQQTDASETAVTETAVTETAVPDDIVETISDEATHAEIADEANEANEASEPDEDNEHDAGLAAEPANQDDGTEQDVNYETDELVELSEPGAQDMQSVEESLNSEIEELLELLGLSESLVQVTNEMITPPEGHWELAEEYRAIINPGGVGQPRDGDARAAFMIYDTERGFEFYRVPYSIHKTQEKIIKAGLPQYLAIRLAYGR